MYNEKIETLINAALADGVLTEKEKQVLLKRAQAEGIDLDEFEIVLEARLIQLKKAEIKSQPKLTPKTNKLGELQKCPACGEIVPILSGVCSSCGYIFNISTTDVRIVEKLESDCHQLVKVPRPYVPLFFALLMLGVGLTFLISTLCDEETTLTVGAASFCVITYYGLYNLLQREQDKENKRLTSADFGAILFDINSKLESAKILYSANATTNARIIGLEKMVRQIEKERKRRTLNILLYSAIISCVMIIIGVIL